VIDLYDFLLVKRIDEQYTRTPFYGSRKMTAFLRREGHRVNRKRVQGLMRQMGLETIYPRPRLSQAHPEHEIYPYLLRNVSLDRVDQVWAADITYIRVYRGFLYLVAIMDWVSRYVVSWELSTSLEVDFCLLALERAFQVGCPEIFNTDQGSQFTSKVFIQKLKEQQVQISMDGRGRVFDNIFTERLWRSLKYEEIYLKDYRGVPEAEEGIGQYFSLYNQERLHQSLNYRTPAEVYFQRAVLL
jgi:putative transposase